MKLLTEFDGNPKVLSVGLCGAGLYARALAYCGRYETDGAIPKAWVEQAVAREGLHDLPDRLVDVGLWNQCENGYEIRDFATVNRTKEQMDFLRENRSKAGKIGVKAKRKQTPSKTLSNSYSLSASPSPEFNEWLDHYRETTGRDKVRGAAPDLRRFTARRKEGYSVDDLKLATVGCHGDDYLREHGYDRPSTILAPSKVARYIELARRGPQQGNVTPLAADLRRLEAERQRLLREEEGAAA